ncbi:uncharacterized protein B0J16DRAFT_298836 [Fusarium flagelliforme]|uniref:uncharacterized protein n=1 Tax=Fusarium flagelliforme TaxID=2675880 RepID=UPI001E8D0D18|nr:uncharacterized protein B0J16DRAFT_298836 [Fusarium flagelliforme]KAH7199029.1 hypothetical protein B0J16DRAFT_298836 [Fusarium flagelliforme]
MAINGSVTVCGASRPRRAYHTKAKTGCQTCRIRKVRCDEAKPACTRCTSTGRKCDGYTSPPSSTPSKSPSPQPYHRPNPAADLKLILPRQSPDELRSYRYFLEVTAPSLAGTFYSEFWLTEVPRVCLLDAAIWHAVVSLGSAHEDFAENGRGSRSLFALKQFNSSICCLTESRSPRHADQWRALVISAIFTHVCTIKGLHDQTRIHLQAGCNLLQELQGCGTGDAKTSQQHTKPESWISSVPISIAPVQSILMNLKLHANALDHGGIVDCPTLLSQNKTINAWRFYTAPSPSTILTQEHIRQTHRAAESLCSGLILFSQENAKHLLDLHTGKSGLDGLSMLAARQEMHTRCFNEISKALEMFQQEMTTPGGPKLEAHTILPVRLSHTTNRVLFIEDPAEHDLVKRQQGLPALFTSIVDLCEKIMNLDPTKTRGVSYTPQLFLVAHSGTELATRQRAVSLLRHPRLDGGWDSLISASVAEAIMDREREAAFQYLGIETAMQEDETDPMFRIYNFTFAFRGSREAQIVLRTWYEKLNEIPGQVRLIQW